MERRLHPVRSSKWPFVTPALLATLEYAAQRDGEEAVNAELLALARARKAIYDALIACGVARRTTASPAAKKRLAALIKALAREHGRFPLTVLSAKPAAKDWAKEPPAPALMTTAPRKRTVKLDRVLSPAESKAALHKIMLDLVKRGPRQ